MCIINSCAHDQMCVAENADDVEMNCVIVILMYESNTLISL